MADVSGVVCLVLKVESTYEAFHGEKVGVVSGHVDNRSCRPTCFNVSVSHALGSTANGMIVSSTIRKHEIQSKSI